MRLLLRNDDCIEGFAQQSCERLLFVWLEALGGAAMIEMGSYGVGDTHLNTRGDWRGNYSGYLSCAP